MDLSNFKIPTQPPEVNDKVEETLKIVTNILKEQKIEYRFWGSVIVAATLGRLHRPLGDIDILIDEISLQIFTNRLKESGFSLKKRKMGLLGLDIQWVEAERNDISPVTIFYGHFNKEKNFEILLNNKLKLVVDKTSLKPTEYTLFGIKFIGIPKETAYLGIYRSRFNPKRKHELLIMQSFLNYDIPRKRELEFFYKNKKVFLGGLLYDVFQFLRNIIGFIRVSFGMEYDFWRPLTPMNRFIGVL